MELQATTDEVLKAPRALFRYSFSLDRIHKKALKAAVQLARYHPSGRRLEKAFRFYLIAHRMDVTRLPEVDRQWIETNLPRVAEIKAAIDFKVDNFFRKRGALQLETRQITVKRGT